VFLTRNVPVQILPPFFFSPPPYPLSLPEVEEVRSTELPPWLHFVIFVPFLPSIFSLFFPSLLFSVMERRLGDRLARFTSRFFPLPFFPLSPDRGGCSVIGMTTSSSLSLFPFPLPPFPRRGEGGRGGERAFPNFPPPSFRFFPLSPPLPEKEEGI